MIIALYSVIHLLLAQKILILTRALTTLRWLSLNPMFEFWTFLVSTAIARIADAFCCKVTIPTFFCLESLCQIQFPNFLTDFKLISRVIVLNDKGDLFLSS